MMGSSGRLVSEVRRFRPDVLHAHMMSSALQGFVAGRLLRVPLVTTVHNSFDRHSFLMRVGRRVVAVSEAERRTLLARGYPAARLVTVLNGTIGSPRSDWAQDRIGELPQPSVMTLSGLHARKGLPDVIDAFARVLPDFPQWHLNIVGNGPDRDHLAELIRVRGLTASVHLQGSTWNPHPLLEQSAIFASGSLAEPFGLVLAEARAAGCAVVATDVGGVPEVLDHGRAGLLCPPSDPAAMSHHFRRLMGDPALLTEWQTRARVGVERFTVARMTADYQRVYEAVSLTEPLLPPERDQHERPPPSPDRLLRAAFPAFRRGRTRRSRDRQRTDGGLGDRLDVHVLYSTRYDDERLRDTAYQLHALDTDRLRYLAGALRRVVSAEDFDVLITAQVEPSVLAWLATRGLRLPTFITHLHGNPRIEEAQGSLRSRAAFALSRRLISPRTAGVLAVAPALRDYASQRVSPHTPVYFAKNPARRIGGAETGHHQPTPSGSWSWPGCRTRRGSTIFSAPTRWPGRGSPEPH